DRVPRGIGDLVAVEADDAHIVGGDGDDLVLSDLERLLGGVHEGGDVRAEEVLALAETDHERGVAACGDHGARGVAVHGEQGEGPVEGGGGAAHRLGEV